MNVIFLFLTLFQGSPATRINVTLTDGTIVARGGFTLDMETNYGLLKIPIKDISRISVGYHLTDEETKIVTKAAHDLGSSVYDERQAAQQSLNKIGERAYVILHKHIKSTDAEVVKRVAVFEKEVKPDTGKVFDYITSSTVSVKGHIANKKVTLHHAVFGDVVILITDIKEIRVGHFSDLVVRAGANWTDTSFSGYDTYNIKATGTIDCYPGTQGYTCSPNGLPDVMGRDGIHKCGALIGKIGDGPPFLVGESRTITTNAVGNLYLKVVENPWNTDSTGEYHVSIVR